MNRSVFFRIAIDIVLAISVMQGWWFAAATLAIVGLWVFPYFAEALIAGFAYDSLFGWVPGYGISGHIGVVVCASLSLVSAFFKKKLRK